MSPPLLPEYVPPNVDLLTERSNLNGLVIAGVAYGRRAFHSRFHGLISRQESSSRSLPNV